MNKATGPKYTVEKKEILLADIAWQQEKLALVGLEYSLLGNVPVDPRSVAITVNGLQKLFGTDFEIDGRKIKYTPALADAGDVVIAVYPTTGPIADPADYTINFDVPGQNIRQNGVSGSLQVYKDPYWYDMEVNVHPITDVLSFDVAEDPSPNQ